MLHTPEVDDACLHAPTANQALYRARLSGAVEGAYRTVKDGYQRSPRLRRLIWQHRVAPAFWTVASLLSLMINIFLIVALLIIGRQLFMLKTAIDKQLLTGLYDNFALMDQAHIVTTISVETTIQVQDTIQVVFDLPLNQDTEVVLTQDTPIDDVSILLNGVCSHQHCPASGQPAGDQPGPDRAGQPDRAGGSERARQPFGADRYPAQPDRAARPLHRLAGCGHPYQSMLSDLPNRRRIDDACAAR